MNITHHITQEVYERLAELICSSLSQPSFFSGTVSADSETATHTLTATLIIYRRRIKPFDNEPDRIIDVVPVWYDCKTLCDDGEGDDDFDFRILIEAMREH